MNGLEKIHFISKIREFANEGWFFVDSGIYEKASHGERLKQLAIFPDKKSLILFVEFEERNFYSVLTWVDFFSNQKDFLTALKSSFSLRANGLPKWTATQEKIGEFIYNLNCGEKLNIEEIDLSGFPVLTENQLQEIENDKL